MVNPNAKLLTSGLTDEKILELTDQDMSSMENLIKANNETIKRLKSFNEEKLNILERRKELERQATEINNLTARLKALREKGVELIKDGYSADAVFDECGGDGIVQQRQRIADIFTERMGKRMNTKGYMEDYTWQHVL